MTEQGKFWLKKECKKATAEESLDIQSTIEDLAQKFGAGADAWRPIDVITF